MLRSAWRISLVSLTKYKDKSPTSALFGFTHHITKTTSPLFVSHKSHSARIVMSAMREGESEVKEQVKLLSGEEDDFGGVIVEMSESLAMDSMAFVSILRASISQWKLEGKKGVWIKLPIELVNLVEVAVKEGFWFHHAEPRYMMLVYWIPQTANTIPANATHRVGIGAFVINDKKEVLVVQENSGKFRGTGVWKFPTGVVDQNEDICAAAVREVKEETGIDAEFVEVLAFRQSHKSFFDKSDLFFVCMLQPITLDIEKQDLEIEAAQTLDAILG